MSLAHVIRSIKLGCQYLGGKECPILVEVQTGFGAAIEVRHSALKALGMPVTIHTGMLAQGAGCECVIFVGHDDEYRGTLSLASAYVAALQRTGDCAEAILALEEAQDFEFEFDL